MVEILGAGANAGVSSIRDTGCGAGTDAGGAGVTTACGILKVTGLPQEPQNFALSLVCFPQCLQNIGRLVVMKSTVR